jgi:hypothetical protein
VLGVLGIRVAMTSDGMASASHDWALLRRGMASAGRLSLAADARCELAGENAKNHCGPAGIDRVFALKAKGRKLTRHILLFTREISRSRLLPRVRASEGRGREKGASEGRGREKGAGGHRTLLGCSSARIHRPFVLVAEAEPPCISARPSAPSAWSLCARPP